MRLSGRENKAARDLYLYPRKWRSIASQTNLCTHKKTGARWLLKSCRVPVFFLFGQFFYIRYSVYHCAVKLTIPCVYDEKIIFFGVISIFHAHHIAYKYCAVIKSNFKFNSNFPHQKWNSHLVVWEV